MFEHGRLLQAGKLHAGEKKGRIVVQCEPENPAKVTKEELDEAIKQAADYLENELKAGRKPRRRYRLINGQMFRQQKTS